MGESRTLDLLYGPKWRILPFVSESHVSALSLMDSVRLPQTSPNKAGTMWSVLALAQQGGIEQLYISGTMWLAHCVWIWTYATAHPERSGSPTKHGQAVALSRWRQQEPLPSVPAAVHVPLLLIKLSNGMPFSLIKGLSEGREGTLFWLEFHKAQVVQPAARSLVLVGCTPALGLFIVLSLVVKEEEWQEGTVGPWWCCSASAAVSGWH